MSNIKKLALAGILSALCFIFLFLGSVFQTLDLTSAALGSIVVLIAYVEIGLGRAWGVYAVASLLSLLLLPYKTAAAVFALFAGFYPLAKVFLNKIKPFWLSLTTRILCFNLFLTAMCSITGNMVNAVQESSKVLSIRGRVLPSTLDDMPIPRTRREQESSRALPLIPRR